MSSAQSPIPGDIFKGLGVEVFLDEREDFLKIVETLTRIGIADSEKKELVQCCHIFHKRGRYRIMHYREMQRFDGENVEIERDDVIRRDQIVSLLKKWGLVKTFPDFRPNGAAEFTILPFSEKSKWKLIPKYRVGLRN